MKKISTIILAFVFACGCSDEATKTKQENPLFSMSRSTTLNKYNKSINLEQMGVYKPTKVFKADSLLIVLDQNGLNKLSVYHEDGKLLASFLPTGTGANEGLYFMTMSLDQDKVVSAFDFGNNRLVELDLKQLGQPGCAPTFTQMPTDKKHLCVVKSGSTTISTGMFEEGRYCLMGNAFKEYFLDYPEIPVYRGANDTIKSVLYASNILKIKPDGTKFVCANMQSGILDLCSFTPCNTITRIIELNLYSPKATVSNTRRKPVAYSTDNLFGFCDIEVTDEYIYALYSGRSYCDYKDDIVYGERIVVFDWAGEHIRTYLLGDPFTSISFCKAENAIYGLTNHPNSVLIKYALD